MTTKGDLKEYLKISRAKVEKSLRDSSGLQSINPQKENADYWIDFFRYDENLSSIENFCRYRTAGAFDVFEDGYDDADITWPVLEHFKHVLLNIDEVVSVKIGKEIACDEKDRTIQVNLKNHEILYFETDTAISLMGDFGKFMRKIIPEVENLPDKSDWAAETYIKYYNLPADGAYEYYRPFKMYYFGELQAQMENKLTSEIEVECYESFKERAANIHTIQNMMLVPYGYNSARGFKLKTYKSNVKIDDRLDLTVKDFKEMISDTTMSSEKFQKRLGLKKNSCYVTLEAVKFLLKYQERIMPCIPVFDFECEKDTYEGWIEKNKIINSCYKFAT